MRLKKAVLTVCVMVMASGIKAQYTMGTTGMMNIPTAEMQQTGTFMIGGNYLPKELNPFKYNSVLPESGQILRKEIHVQNQWRKNCNDYSEILYGNEDNLHECGSKPALGR